jgi:hypothetical protein
MTTIELQNSILIKFGIGTINFKRVFYNRKSLRLTKLGLQLLQNNYENWVFKDHRLVAHDSIALQRKMTYPYYMDRKNLVLFTEVDAFMAKMAGVKGWIDGK